MKKIDNLGFSHTELLLAILIITFISFAGYRIMTKSHALQNNSTSTTVNFPNQWILGSEAYNQLRNINAPSTLLASFQLR